MGIYNTFIITQQHFGCKHDHAIHRNQFFRAIFCHNVPKKEIPLRIRME